MTRQEKLNYAGVLVGLWIVLSLLSAPLVGGIALVAAIALFAHAQLVGGQGDLRSTTNPSASDALPPPRDSIPVEMDPPEPSAGPAFGAKSGARSPSSVLRRDVTPRVFVGTLVVVSAVLGASWFGYTSFAENSRCESLRDDIDHVLLEPLVDPQVLNSDAALQDLFDNRVKYNQAAEALYDRRLPSDPASRQTALIEREITSDRLDREWATWTSEARQRVLISSDCG